MRLIQYPQRHQHQTGTQIDLRQQIVFDVGLLDLGFALVACAGNRMLDFEFGIHTQFIVETVPEKQHEAIEVDLILDGAILVIAV
ncbi:hypothetical protein GALL_512680 [mine drainage metagenome]|uniref:Uncharacterized protein n=1 Tax=mine drainage metagenome TaxID=410659 RepID=A0A1J5PPD7_9ZZZZ